jgi:TorA maturation chaperone TorD
MREMPHDARVPAQDEEQSRAGCYKLLSRLFYGAPDAALLAGIEQSANPAMDNATATAPALAHVDGAANPCARTFSELQAIARIADVDALRQTYDDLFIGAGKAPITTYTAGYAAPHAPDRHLLELREWIAAWGLRRRDGVFETEDHVSAICDVMRWLIEHDCAIEAQRDFFDRFVYAGTDAFCTAIHSASSRPFYYALASLAQAFLAVEKEAFDLHAA